MADKPKELTNAEQDYRDKKTKEAEDKAPTTKSTMGEGRLFGSAVEDEQAAQNRREINRLPKKLAHGGSVGSASKRADGIASRGKTKGRFV